MTPRKRTRSIRAATWRGLVTLLEEQDTEVLTGVNLKLSKDPDGFWVARIEIPFEERLWLTPECEELGCNVSSTFMVTMIADAVVHYREGDWHPFGRETLYRARVFEDVIGLQRDPVALAKARLDLARAAHDNPKRRTPRSGLAIEFDTPEDQ